MKCDGCDEEFDTLTHQDGDFWLCQECISEEAVREMHDADLSWGYRDFDEGQDAVLDQYLRLDDLD